MHWSLRLCLLALLGLGATNVSGCNEPPESTPVVSPMAKTVPVDSPPRAASTAVHEPATHPVARREMPNDAVHAGLRRKSQGTLPAGHPPVGTKPTAKPARSPAPTPVKAETGKDRPLPLEGPGSAAELARRLALLPPGPAGDDVRRRIDLAFRMTFTVERPKRNPKEASVLLEGLGEHTTAAATAARILGYVAVSTNFDVANAFRHYQRAVDLQDDYGEAHYALAFMHAMKDRDRGKQHYERALALGVPDVRGLKRFYGDARDH